uniref:Dirigent protein n=1 Tax=Oryza punctata TaxID=4537 RepID=A0A0E0JRS4_ORYPU
MAAAGSSKTASLLICLTMIFFVQQLQSQFVVVAAAAAAASPSDDKSSKELHGKKLSFTLYQQETINKTGYMVVDGVAGAGVSQTTTPFGTVYVFRDELTVRAERSSRVAGVVEGSSVTTSFDGLRSLSLGKITLDHRGRRGSLSVLGGTHNTQPSDCPVVGGTGDFAYAIGYVRTSPVNLRGSSITFKVEFHLYWPPYAHYAPASKH